LSSPRREINPERHGMIGDIRLRKGVYYNASCVHLTDEIYQFGLKFGLYNAKIDQDERADASGYMGITSTTSTG